MVVTVERHPTVAEAARALGPGRSYYGGGTLLMRDVNYGRSAGTLVLCPDPSLREIRAEGDRIRIGASATMAQVAGHPDLAALARVARAVGGPAVRQAATVGGNLFAEHPYGDFATALLAVEAQVLWASGQTEPIESFLAARTQPRGLVAAVSVPRLQPSDLLWRKVSRVKPKGVSVMSVAVWLARDGARIAFGGMGSTPLRAKAAERALGTRRDAQSVDAACAVATEGLTPVDDALASAWYRREVAPVHLRRCLVGEP